MNQGRERVTRNESGGDVRFAFSNWSVRGVGLVCAGLVGVLLLAGCANPNVTRMADWTGRQLGHGVQGMERVLAGLRPAPMHAPTFYHAGHHAGGVTGIADTGDAGLNTHRLAERLEERLNIESLVEPTRSRKSVNFAEPVSYVRLSGRPEVADWSACERSAGQAFAGTRVADGFDACLRAKGYVPEGEAQRLLAR